MYNFNDEERSIFEIYKGVTKDETLDNLNEGYNEVPNNVKEIINRVKEIISDE